MERKPPITKISDNTYIINEFDGTNCYLLIGEERAMLIDCGTGFCDLKGAIRDITSLPIIVVATHGHCDHIGGAGQFKELYIHEDDMALINRLQLSLAMRKLFLASNGAVKAHGFTTRDVKKGDYKPTLIPIKDGHKLSLGEREIIVKHTPGHSKGSIALIDEKNKLIFSGDNVCDALWMQLPGATTLEEWLPSAKWLYDMSENYKIYWGHRVPELARDYIAAVIGWGEEIINTQKNSAIPKITQYPKQSDGIIYNTSKIHKR